MSDKQTTDLAPTDDVPLTAVDARRCAFVCWVDLDGSVHLTSHSGYSQRQVATMLRQVADVTDRKANEAGEPQDDPPAPTDAGGSDGS